MCTKYQSVKISILVYFQSLLTDLHFVRTREQERECMTTKLSILFYVSITLTFQITVDDQSRYTMSMVLFEQIFFSDKSSKIFYNVFLSVNDNLCRQTYWLIVFQSNIYLIIRHISLSEKFEYNTTHKFCEFSQSCLDLSQD